MNKLIFLSVLFSVMAGCASHKPNHAKHVNHQSSFTSETPLHFSYTGPEVVSFAGLANYDELSVGGGSGVLYPGGHPAVFLASVLAHAGTVEAIKESKRSAIEENANKVIVPYIPFLKEFKYQQLLKEATNSLVDSETNSHHQGFKEDTESIASGQWIMESSPKFFMLQDSGALILQNSIALYENAEKPQIVYQNVVEVISLPYQGENPERYWMENNGERIATISRELMTDSMSIAINDALKEQIHESQQQTFRFYQEGKKTYERGNLIAADFDRLTIRTLRGWIKSVPIINDDSQHFKPYNNDQSIASIIRGIGVYY